MMRLPHLPAGLVSQKNLTKRLQAWWDGYYYEPEAEDLPEVEEEDSEEEFAAYSDGRKAAAWSDPRMRVAEEIWGEGFLTPGGEREIESLIRPLGLDSSMMIVDMGAGLGGTTRALHNLTGAWVSGFEASPLMAEAGSELSHLAGLQRKATVEAFDLESLSLRSSGFNAVFSKEAIYTLEDKETLYNKLYECLRVDGQLLITDYLTTKPESETEEIKKWMAAEPTRPHLWSLEKTRDFISDLGFEVRITEDITPKARKQILTAIAAFTERIKPNSKSVPGWGPAVIAEIEMWANRIKVLDSGDVGVFRIYGRKFDPALK
jgi:cyclopropane fatty-acyl-phospholipid synthase-like methyltransferase